MATPITKAASQASGSAFGFVTTFFSQATNIINVVGAGADMLNKFVDKAAEKQHGQDASEMDDFWQNLADEASIERTRRQAELAQELHQKGPEFKALYDKNAVRIRAVLQEAAAQRGRNVSFD